MLSARVTVVQVLDVWQVGIMISEFAPGLEPTQWVQKPVQLSLPVESDLDDSLSTILAVIRLWSERTISG
jgi:hypothetical protein